MRLTLIIISLTSTTTSHLIEAATIRPGPGHIDRASFSNLWRLNEHEDERLNRPRPEDEYLAVRDEYSLLHEMQSFNSSKASEYMDVRIYKRQRREDEERQDVYTLESSTEQSTPNNKTKWIAHGTISILCFGLLIPTSISAALFRHIFPAYWIYIHVTINVATFILVSSTVCVAFVTMNSLGDANEGHLKELHHIVGLGLLMLLSFQTANGFLRPPREFRTEDEEDTSPGAIHSFDWDRDNFTPRKLWYLVHRITGMSLFVLGTWQIQSGLGLYAEKYNGVDWGSVYLGYVGWLVFVLGVVKLWMIYKKRGVEDGDEYSEEDDLS